jgi:hypothetical protein
MNLKKNDKTSFVNFSNYANITVAIDYLNKFIAARLQTYFGKKDFLEVEQPFFCEDESPFSQFIINHLPNNEEYLLLVLSLVPSVDPNFFTRIIKNHLPEGGDFPDFGGARGLNHRGILPTGETAQFILAGNDLAKRLEVQRLFTSDHWFYQEGILRLETMPEGEPAMSGRILMDAEWVEHLTLGRISPPRFGAQFPAARLHTEMEWTDLVLPLNTMRQIQEIQAWVQHAHTLSYTWGMAKRIKPGFRALFYGPPGTGKTLTATLLGKYTGKEVYRIDLSLVVSKFIGETEKNLSTLFDKAQNKNWILFFDEADALFGKRTDVRDAHDKYANQEVSYLLQKIEDFPGLSILASNFRSNIDDAFIRRFQTIIYFPLPKAEERLLLWQRAMPQALAFAPDVNLPTLAQQYELTGSNIVNIIQYCCFQLLADGEQILTQDRIVSGIKRELVKENKMI